VRVSEVDLQPGRLLDAGVVEHLVALVPGQGPPQPGRQLSERSNERVSDDLGAVSAPDRHQHGEPRLAFDQGRDRGTLPAADDQVALPVPDLAAGLDHQGTVMDRLHHR